MYETAFTPWASLGGGVLIGLSAVLLMLVAGPRHGRHGHPRRPFRARLDP
jgi:hypothetical protein